MKEGDKNALVDTTANFQKLIDINARHDEVRDVINGRVQDKKVIIELQDVFYVQYLSLDSLRSGKVQYYNRHIMDYNQAHNYNPAITLCNKDLVYPADFAESYVEELTGRIMQTGDADAYLIRGSIYLNQKEYAKAIEDFSAILEKEPDNLLALFNLANARMLMFDYIESVDDKTPRIVGEQQQMQRKIDYSQVIEGYNECLRIGEIERAIETFNQVLRLDKDIAEAYFNRGLLYIYTGQKALANADLSKAGELGIVSAYNVIKRYCKEN